MITVQAVIVNSRGLHARPSAKLAKLAASYESTLTLCKGSRKANAKSVAALLMLAASEGTELKIIAEGSDEKQAAAALLELIAGGFSDDSVPNNPHQPEAALEESGVRQVHKISGIGIGDAVVSGQAHIHHAGTSEVPRYRIGKAQLAAEIARYERALAQVREEGEVLRQRTAALPGAAEITPFIELYRMLLADDEFARKPQQLIRRRLINAEWALKERVEVIGDNFRRLQDSYLRERQRDIEQVMERLLAAMEGKSQQPRREIAAGENALLVAAELAPADVIHLRQLGYKGFITESGSASSHTAILARSMNLPALIGARGVLSCLHHNDLVLLDAHKGVAIINPTAADVRKHKQGGRKKSAAPRRVKGGGEGVTTADGARVFLNLNIELPEETAQIAQFGADGIGLFRTEFLFMHRADLPSEEEQFEIYRHVLAKMAPLPVVIRTLDIGGDKMPAAAAAAASANPALGVRAIRYCLAQPDLFMTQLRALLRAAAQHNNLRLLLPMLTHPQELARTVQMLAAVREQLRATHGIDAPLPPLGAMIEVPAAVFVMRALAKHLSFFSIGTNDLIQYMMAVDRNDETLISLCDPLHPAVLQMLALIVANANRARLPLTLCGELAGDLQLTPLMLGLGLRDLSMMPPAVEAVRERVRAADCTACAKLARRALRAPHPDAAREIIEKHLTEDSNS